MVILGHWDGRPLAISVKPNCLTVSIDGPDQADVFSFDYAGRLWTAYLDGIAYRRGLDGRVLARWRQPGSLRQRQWLSLEEAERIEERARLTANAVLQAVQSGSADLNAPLPHQGNTGLQRAVDFDATRSRHDSNHYRQVYKPVGILPPDQYMAVVLQAAEGCSFNTCTFCTFFRDRPFHIKTPDTFRAHAVAVREFLGEGLSLRRTIFLGDANALVIPMPRLLPLIDIVHQEYDVWQLGGIYAFLDGFSGERKSAQDYSQLAERGLARVYVGLESGNEPLLKFLRKPGTPGDAVTAVRAMKEGGLAVGVIVLLGPGGHQYAQAHVADTIAALNNMSLGRGDIIYLSQLIADDSIPYAQEAQRAGLRLLSHEEQIAQGDAIEQGLTFPSGTGMPIISRYDIREFVY